MIATRAAFAILAAIAVSAPAQANVTISSDATNNMSCSSGVCSPTASDAVLNVSDLESMLASGNVTVKTTGSGGVQATNIVVGAGLSWSGHTVLGLDASESIVVQKKVSVSGGGGLSLVTNDGGTGGELWIVKGGRVVFGELSSPLSINGTSYKLIKNIATLAKLIAKHPKGGAYALANNYNASADGTYTTSPIVTMFTGYFEGLGNTISNLTIATKGTKRNHPPTGFFGQVSGGMIENLRLIKISVKSSSTRHGQSSTGGMVGDSGDTLFNDSVSGRVSAAEGATVGGLVGGTDRYIIASHSTAHVTGGKNSYVGGLVGATGAGEVSNSYATGVVSGKYVAGGLVGLGGGGQVQGCLATGNVSAGAIGGGLVGYNTSSEGLFNSYATGAVIGTSSSSQIGGFIGLNGGGSASSYSIGAVSENGGLLGGFVGEDDSGGGISDSYWDLDTSGISDPSQGAGNIANDPGITGLTSEQFQSGLPAGFDPNTWAEDSGVNNGFPYLIANPPPK